MLEVNDIFACFACALKGIGISTTKKCFPLIWKFEISFKFLQRNHNTRAELFVQLSERLAKPNGQYLYHKFYYKQNSLFLQS